MRTGTTSTRRRKKSSSSSSSSSSTSSSSNPNTITSCLKAAFVFLLGFVCCATIMLFVLQKHPLHETRGGGLTLDSFLTSSSSSSSSQYQYPYSSTNNNSSSSSTSLGILAGKRILVAVASYDFVQLPHLEEVLDSYRDVCEAGAFVDVYIHTTQPYPVALIDLWNTRFSHCGTDYTNINNKEGRMKVTIVLKSPSLRLNLVDCHRTLFYSKLQNNSIPPYDLFVYTEDDIRVTPSTLASYLRETALVQHLVGGSIQQAAKYNVGIVRYEYNYPPDVIINDKTRYATEKTTRVYWEHVKKPLLPSAVDLLSAEAAKLPSTQTSQHSFHPNLSHPKNRYLYMTNHHQGMFMATPSLLHAWAGDQKCQFDKVRPRPHAKNNPHQPSEGTQRVWMSSHMLYGGRHCHVQQLLPLERMGSLTVWHLPNKNYRRVGKKGRLGGNENENAQAVEYGKRGDVFEGSDESLVSSLELHLELRLYSKTFVNNNEDMNFNKKAEVYRGVVYMVNEIDPKLGFRGKRDHDLLVQRRMKEYGEYVRRGGVLTERDIREALLEVQKQKQG